MPQLTFLFDTLETAVQLRYDYLLMVLPDGNKERRISRPGTKGGLVSQ
jgi:hypothetical protein